MPVVKALACGKPVIRRDAYAVREHIVNSRAGVLFKRVDAQAMVSAIRQVLTNYERYASPARKYAETSDVDHIASDYAKAYVGLLRRNRP